MALAVLQVVLGLILGLQYKATLNGAHSSVIEIRQKLALLQGFHYWGSSVQIAIGALLVLLAVFSKLRKAPYFACFGAFAVSMGFQITGNLFPFDRHGVQTATMRSSGPSRARSSGSLVNTP